MPHLTDKSSMDREFALQFARQWIEHWNRKNVDAIVSHYALDVSFVSPKALAIVGDSVLKGREALTHYWKTAVSRISSICFTLDRILWDDEQRELGVLYIAELAGQRSRACKMMIFNAQGEIVRGEALYGAPV